jgi:hypothetical protein
MGDQLANVDHEKAGALAAKLLCNEASWVRRRKLRVDFIDDVAMRLRQSVDFCIPDGVEPIGRRWGKRHVHLPLFVLRKAPEELIDFDLEDARGTSLSLPTRRANAELSRQALLASAAGVLGLPTGGAAPAKVSRLIERVALEDPPQSLNACDDLIGRTPEMGSSRAGTHEAALAADPDFRFLARLVAWASIVAMPVEVSAGEQLVKLAYSEPITEWKPDWKWRSRAGLGPLPTQIDLPYVGAQTFHLETHPPQGMAVSRGLLAVGAPGNPPYRFTEAAKRGRSVHLYLPGVEEGRSGAAPLELSAQRPGFMNNARSACLAVSAVLGLSIVFASPLAEANRTVPTLLLFLPGLLATVVLQPMGHALTRKVLTGVRYAVMVSAALAFLAAFWLIAAPQVTERVTVAAVLDRPPPGRSSIPEVAVAPAVPAATTEPLRKVAAPERTAHGWLKEQRPSTKWLRIVWGLLFLISLAASGLVWAAHQRSSP